MARRRGHMNASDYLQRSTLYRKLIHGPYGEFSRVYAARLSDEGLGRQCTWRSLSLFRDLMDWHVGNGHDPQDLSEVHVDRFLEHRFKHWSPDSGDRSALRRLLAACWWPSPSRPASAVAIAFFSFATSIPTNASL
ncbi:hypothetical protein MPLSOD_410026 [Mesorhizobium sp. SOD10]|nr:hypothetical protein MPLSOD_410026 [Mesorhizobium sp. SOD10]